MVIPGYVDNIRSQMANTMARRVVGTKPAIHYPPPGSVGFLGLHVELAWRMLSF
jgi:hypothetical protein